MQSSNHLNVFFFFFFAVTKLFSVFFQCLDFRFDSVDKIQAKLNSPVLVQDPKTMVRICSFGKKSKRRSPFGLFESCREKRISLCFMRRLGKLVHFGGRAGLRMKIIAKKELNLLFQMTPSRILYDR